MQAEVLLVFSTFPDAEKAGEVARRLVEEKLAACANILPGLQSIYTWEGSVTEASEVLCLFKVTRDGYPALARRLAELHPYEVPEIIGLSVAEGLPAYLGWVAQECVERKRV